jgi:hypothetical protein
MLVVRRWMRTVGTATGLAFVVNSSANVPEKNLKLLPDARFAKLERFFRIYNCPAPQHIMAYLTAADRYALDYRLLPALSIRETQCGRQERQNNRWGYHSGRQAFASIEAGIDFVAQQLSLNRLYRGKTVQEKLFIYNPLPSYPEEVKRIMQQVK